MFQNTPFTLDGNPFITPEAQVLLSGNNTDAVGIGVREAIIRAVPGDNESACLNCIFASGDNGLDTTALIDTDGDGIADQASGLLRRRLEEVGSRFSQDTFTSIQFQIGIRGGFGDSNWTYDGYYQTGQTENVTAQLGNVNRDRFNQALLLATDDDGQVILDANGNPSCSDTSENGATIGCTPLNIFGEDNISEDAAAFLRTAVAATAVFEQDIAEFSVAGDTEGWLELPGGSIGLAFGIQHIENRFDFIPSQDLAAGTIAGFNGAPAVSGQYKVDEYYAEAYLPILAGVPFAEVLDVELAYRSSDYDTIGTTEAYKISGSWAPIESFRIRTGFNRAVRAPNIAELFSPEAENFPGATDPCSSDGGDQSQAVRDLCIATGVPADVVFTSVIDPAAGQVRSIGGGNPLLQEEEADTFTFGVVLTPLDNLSISLDYFDIEIDDVISGAGTNNLLDICYNNTDIGGLGSTACNRVTRRSDGSIDFVDNPVENAAFQTLKGFDLIANYSFELYGGTASIDYLGTFTDERDFLSTPGGRLIECAGNFGDDCGEPTPDYKHRTTFKWTGDNITAQLLWRFVGSVDDDAPDTVRTVDEIGTFNYFDASASYVLSENYRFTLGIDNIFDKEPPVIGDNDEQANTFPATYDVFGRTFYASFTATF
ncbi:TonB-dependent receptor [Alteromonadaceae bacterium M269]|nr:TonB-dependent receptor [Alteromonadaceae bacterium M269]